MRSLMCVSAYVLSCLVLMPEAGCGKTGMKAFNVELDLAPTLRNQTVLVDLVGVSPANKTIWMKKKLKEYWNEDDPFRSAHSQFLHTMEFKAGESGGANTLGSDHSIWDQWKDTGALWLLIISDRPASRNNITLDSCFWDPTARTIKVRVNSAGVFIDTAPLEERRD